MHAITDTVMLGPDELDIIKNKYTKCQVSQIFNSNHMIQQFKVIIFDEREEDYFKFLLVNLIAMSSSNFYSKVKSDIKFRSRIRTMLSREDIPEQCSDLYSWI